MFQGSARYVTGVSSVVSERCKVGQGSVRCVSGGCKVHVRAMSGELGGVMLVGCQGGVRCAMVVSSVCLWGVRRVSGG